MKNFFIICCFVITNFLFVTCNTTEPPIDDIPPGKSDYLWSIDSVDYGNLPGTIQLESIWGSSASDVWGAGYSSDVRDCLWHYDGKTWTRATENSPIMIGGNGSKIVGRVWGTASNDVWAIGGRILSNSSEQVPFVIHFDGIHWTEVIGTTSNMPNGCNAIYGVTKDDYWIAELGSIVHYKNGIWTKYILNENLLGWGITGYLGNIYAIAYDISQTGNSAYIFLVRNDQIIQIDETTITDLSGNYNGKFEPSKLFVNNGELFTAWHKISSTAISLDGKIDQNGWHSILSLSSGQFFINTFYHNKKDIFIVGNPSLIMHFNGTDWAKIDINVPNHTVDSYAIFWGVWTDGNEVFISDTENGIVYHGK